MSIFFTKSDFSTNISVSPCLHLFSPLRRPSSLCLGVNECLNPAVHKCAQLCTDTLTGYYCSCHPGYGLMPDGKACEDLNECLTTPAVCSQICENAAGSYHCKCAPGYIREADGRTCRQNSGVAPYLLYSNRYYIRNLTTDGSHLSVVLQGLSNVVALDFDDSEKRLYWLDAGTGKIERMRFDGTDRETLADDVAEAEGLALDWVGRYVEGTSFLQLSFSINKSFFDCLFNKLVWTTNFLLAFQLDSLKLHLIVCRLCCNKD